MRRVILFVRAVSECTQAFRLTTPWFYQRATVMNTLTPLTAAAVEASPVTAQKLL